MQKAVLATFAVFALPLTGIVPAVSAQCDISQTKCALEGSKCNIHFKNRTDDSGGSDGSSNLQQTSSAQTIVVKAIDKNGERQGNKLQIVAGASKTMNLEKKAKKDFLDIQAQSQDFSGVVTSVKITCEEVKAVLNGNGTCKIFHGRKSNAAGNASYYLGYQCDGGNVGGPTDASGRY